MRILFTHIIDPLNAGDRVCSPMPYFSWGSHEAEEVDFRAENYTFSKSGAVILGGGGLMCEGGNRKIARIWSFCRRNGIKIIGWGFGHNLIGPQERSWPRFLGMFDLIAIRDRIPNIEYCPCPSCLHPSIRAYRDTEPKHERVYYSHMDRILDSRGQPHLTNARAAFEFEYVMSFIASGATVVTSTFHGAYWGLLMNRKVVVPDAWATRFQSLPAAVGRIESDAYRLPRYLDECEFINRRFYDKTCKLLGI